MPVLSKITLLVAVASFSVVFGAPNPQTSGVETAASDSAAPPFPFEEVVLTEADIQAYPELAFADVAYSDAPVVDTVPAKVKRTDWSIPRTCKFAPFDNRWPSNTIWSIINLLTDKSLIKTTPLAAPCYQGPLYDQAKCAQIRANWSDSDLHDQHPSSIMSPLFQGASCLPIDDPTKTCTIGGYPYYVIKATSVFDVQVAVNAARNLNLRLVVKNTGHDFSGKSSGGNSLSIWTHHLKGINFMPNLNAFGYKGPAFKVGSGIQGFEIYEAAAKQGLMVVGGEGMTVGYAGGYLQGGGHSPLSSILGITGTLTVLVLGQLLMSARNGCRSHFGVRSRHC